MKKTVLIATAILIVAAQAMFASGTPEPEEDAVIEYSFLTVFDESPQLGHKNPGDTVTPVIEEMWGIRCNEIIYSGGMTPIERINMLVAAGNLPDVVLLDAGSIISAFETGAFATLTEYQSLMQETDIYLSDAAWNRLSYNGELIALSHDLSGGYVDVENPTVAEMIANDVTAPRVQNWALVANEKILAAAGYAFKPMREIQAELDQNPRTITEADYALDPPLRDIEDFEEMLRRIKALDLTNASGQSIIPLSMPDWAAYHLSILFAPHGGWYANPETMEISGYIMNPGMEEYHRTWVEWYQDGLIDENYLIQKPDQYQEKAASGRLALFLPALDLTVVRRSLKDEDPNNDLRPIPWPESSQGRYIDPGHPAGWGNLMFNKDFEHIPEVMEYFDWFQTDEAQILMSWGPESNGIWEVVNGERRFTDLELAEAIRTGTKTADGRDGASYGIDNMNRDNVLVPSSRAYMTGPAFLYERHSVKRSWPFEQDAYIEMWYHLSGPQLGLDGTVLPGRGPLSNEVGGYYWGTTRLTKIAQLLTVDSDVEFDQVWEEVVNDFILNTPYEAAVEEIRPHFEASLGVTN